jgi:hypothetical protein
VDAAEVVVVDVLGQVALESGEADVEVAGEGGSPALLEDQPVERFDRAVRLRSAGPDQGVADAELGKGGAKSSERNSLPLSESIRSSRQPASASSAQTRRASFEVWAPVGLPCGQVTSSAQANEEATSIAVSCQTEPFVPCSRPTKKQSIPS